MRNPLLALVPERKSSGAWGSPLGQLIASYLRDSDSAALVNNDAAMRVATFASCVRLISCTVGALPLGMFRDLGDGKKEPIATSLTDILVRPNNWQTGQEWREQMTGHVLTHGNGYSWVSWIQVPQDGQVVDRVKELIPLHPDRVEVEAVETGIGLDVRYWLHRDRGDRLLIPADEMFHLRGFSSDGVKGRSILEDAREQIGGALATLRFANRLFEHDATAGVVIKHPTKLSEPAAARLRDQWDDLHRGQTRRTAVLEEGMTLEKLTIAPNDAQFLETREYQRSEIAGLFPVPPHLVGLVDRSTSWGTGIEQQNIQWLQYMLLPLIKRWENTIGRVLIVRDRDLYVKHNLNGLLRGDAASRAQFYKAMVEINVLTPNDVRAYEDLNPLPGGDRVWSEIQAEASAPADPEPVAED